MVDLVLTPYRLDPGAVEYLVEESLQGGADVPVQVACRALARHPSAEQRANIAEFVGRLVERRDVLRRLQKSISAMGRCPRQDRTWLAQILRPQQTAVLPRTLLPAAVSPKPHVKDLSLDGNDWNLLALPELLDRLASVDARTGRVQIRLGSFMYASSLAVLAEWILQNDAVDRVELCAPDEMSRYLERVQFRKVLRDPDIRISADPMDWAVGLTRIHNIAATEAVTEKIVDIIDTFVSPGKEDRQGFHVLIAEMIENIHRHARTRVDGLAVAQVYPKRLKMGITFVDSGIGVRSSFEEGDPSIRIDELTTDEAFLREACKLHVTSKRSQHSGYGLYLLSEVVARNRGTFSVTSGEATRVAYLRQGQVVFDSYAHATWPGTIVSVIIDLNQALPILDVYREMPVLEGYADDDLFTE